jgi:rhamnogalacturonan endolyase
MRALIGGLTAALLAATLAAVPVTAANAAPTHASAPELEALDRGLVAARTSEGVFLSWRLLGWEVTGQSATELTGADFNVYRGKKLIATVTDSSNFLDGEGVPGEEYRVAAVTKGTEGRKSDPVSPWSDAFIELKLQKPADGVTPPTVAHPEGEPYTYAANDMSVGDVDGDGQYEYVVKWDPSNSKDVSQVGYTGTVFIDTYEADGTLLHQLDLGPNIRAGAHYTQFLVYDFDGDGRSEMMLKTAPGTKTIKYNTQNRPTTDRYITLPKEDRQAGYSNADDYRLSASGYYQHLVDIFRQWPQHPEVLVGHWPSTVREALNVPADYPQTLDTAEALADYFIDVYAPSRSTRNNLRAFEGFILDGPEYLTVFDGRTGRELQTVPYQPGRGDDGLLWGDYALARIEPGNRVDRFLSGVAYLDGTHPSAVFARGYYTRTTLVGYDWNGRSLQQRWFVDSGHVPMTNPFNSTQNNPHFRDGADPKYGSITGQGFHSLSASDVDGDGKHEIVYGAATIDDNGDVLYSSKAVLPAGSASPGTNGRLGHGDAIHVTDIDPHRPGKEIFTVHENGTSAPYGYALRDAATGEVLYGQYTGRDTGRGMIGDVRTDVPGLETWPGDPGGASNPVYQMRSAAGVPLGSQVPGTNQSIRWAADMTTQIVNGSGAQTPTIDDWTRGRLLTATETATNNGTKGNPSLVADVFGDWREELLVRTTDSSAIRIYLSTELTDRKLYTLTHDVQYRAEVARQQTTYNQPSYTSFYLGSDINWSTVPVPQATWTSRPRS